MADLASDKQIYELMQIKLGLEQASDRIFAGLLNQKEADPLDDIFKSLTNKNKEIDRLKKQLTKAQLQIQSLKKNPGSGMQFFQIQQRHKSLPPTHEQKIKNVQQNKKAVSDARQQLKDRTESFIIFLIKCIRQLSRNARPEDTERLVKKFEGSLKKQQQRILDTETKIRAPSEASTSYSRDSQPKLKALIQSISKTSNKQTMFQTISKSLGLEDAWHSFISPLKKKEDLLKFLTDKIIKHPNFQLKLQKPAFEELIQRGHQKWNIIAETEMNNVITNTSRSQISNIVNNMLEQKKLEMAKSLQPAIKLTLNTVQYFYESLDQMFVKHNQHPFELVKRANFKVTNKKVQELLKQYNWDSAQRFLKDQIDEAFRFIQRKTKFYSANRVILRNR